MRGQRRARSVRGCNAHGLSEVWDNLSVRVHECMQRFIVYFRPCLQFKRELVVFCDESRSYTDLLEVLHKLLDKINTFLLQLSSEQGAGTVLLDCKAHLTPEACDQIGTYLSQPGQFLVVFKEESKVLVRNIHIGVATQASVFFFCFLSARETVFVDFVLDLIRGVCHEDAGVDIRCAHFGLGSLKGGEELGMDQSRLGVLQFHGNVSGETEVWILVDGTWNQARDIALCAKDVGERV